MDITNNVVVGAYVMTSHGHVGYVVSINILQTNGFASFAYGSRPIATVHIGSKNGAKLGVSDFVDNLSVLPKP